MGGIEMKNGLLVYYGNPAGYVKDDRATVDMMFQSKEFEEWLSEKKFIPNWSDGIFERLSKGEQLGASLETISPLKNVRIWQLKSDSDLELRFRSYDEVLKVSCSDCGDIYRRTYWNNRGKKSTVWRCVTRLEEGPKGCTSRTISEEDLHSAVAEAFNQVLGGGESMITILWENIESVVCESNEQAIANIEKQMEEKQMELISYANSGKDYEKLADEIQDLSERKQAILTAEAASQGEKDRITEMMEFIENHADQSLDYDEELVRLLVEKVTVFENNVVVRFKSGIEVEI